MVVQDLLAPALERVAEGPDLIDRVGATSGDGLVEENGGVDDVVGEVHVTDGLLGQPRPEQFVVGVTDAESEQQPVLSSFVESLGALQEQLSDLEQWVVSAAAMAERLVLDPPTDLVDAPVGDPHDVEGIGHPRGVVEMGEIPAR